MNNKYFVENKKLELKNNKKFKMIEIFFVLLFVN
jgi:hypothetical protein